MIARLFVHLPFFLTIPEGEQFSVFEYEDSGIKVRVFPPLRSEKAPAIDVDQQIKIDGIPTSQADTLRIDFDKESFQRGKDDPCDPNESIIGRAINSFLIRLRHVARSPKVRMLNFPQVTWRLQYLNSDESEIEKDERLIRGRFARRASLSWIAVTKEVWNNIYSLPIDYEPPPWETLLLDASDDLPNIGPSIVLAATALEVFISNILNQLADNKNFPLEFWEWVNHRNDYRQEPSLEEQYSFLLKFFTGHSLKDEPTLWESFKNLKTARNSFVHEGVVRLSKKTINASEARDLINAASKIIQKVKEWIPSELHWTEFKHTIKVESQLRLL